MTNYLILVRKLLLTNPLQNCPAPGDYLPMHKFLLDSNNPRTAAHELLWQQKQDLLHADQEKPLMFRKNEFVLRGKQALGQGREHWTSTEFLGALPSVRSFSGPPMPGINRGRPHYRMKISWSCSGIAQKLQTEPIFHRNHPADQQCTPSAVFPINPAAQSFNGRSCATVAHLCTLPTPVIVLRWRVILA